MKKKNASLVFSQIPIFFLGLNIPIFSYAAFVAYSLFLLFFYSGNFSLRHKGRKRKICKSFSISLVILLAFSLIHYPLSYSYGFTSQISLIQGISLPSISYCVGYYSGQTSTVDELSSSKVPICLYSLLSLILGGVLFSYLSTASSSNASLIDLFKANSPGIEITERAVRNYWGSGLINGTSIDLYNALGVSTISTLFLSITRFKLSKEKSASIFLCLLSAITVAASCFATLSLLGRKTLLLLVVVLLSTIVQKIIFFSGRKLNYRKLLMSVALCLFLSVLILVLRTNADSLAGNFGSFRRFSESGLDTNRYQIWSEIIGSFHKNLFGGRNIRISGGYAHNLWLDSFYDSGILPFILIVVFHIRHVASIIYILRTRLSELLSLFMSAVLLCFAVTFQTEPILQASTIFFSMSCFFFGFTLRIANEIKQHRERNYTLAKLYIS